MPGIAESLQLLDPILDLFSESLTTRIAGHLVTAHMRGQSQMLAWARATKDNRITVQPFEGPSMQEAVTYADKHCATLVRGLNTETKDRLAKIISNGIENKRGIPGLQADLRREFRDMVRNRAEVIARTETADALGESFLVRAKAMGVTGKRWMPTDPCPICAGNAAIGTIPINEMFPSGHLREPAHANCRCALAPVMLEQKEREIAATRTRIEREINDFADEIASANIEHSRAISPNGDVLLTKSGNKNSVGFTKYDIDKIRNAEVFVHNHPGSTSFSFDDIQFAATYNIQKMEISSELYRYSMSPKTYWPDADTLRIAYGKRKEDIMSEAIGIFQARGQTEADRFAFHSIWEGISKELGLNYSRRPV